MVVTYYIKIFRTEPDRHNGMLMSRLLLLAETIGRGLVVNFRNLIPPSFPTEKFF